MDRVFVAMGMCIPAELMIAHVTGPHLLIADLFALVLAVRSFSTGPQNP